MKKIVSLALIAVLLTGINAGVTAANKPLKGQITLSGAFALYPLAVVWASEFKKLYPDVRIDISGGGTGKGITDALSGVVELGMVSRDLKPEELRKGAWFIPVAIDAVVPTVNARNPKIKEALAKGLTQTAATKIFITQEYKTWGQLLGISSGIPLHVYTRSDACGAGETWAKYTGNNKQEDLKGTAVFGDPGVASAVQKDPVAIGYNNIAYAYDLKTKRPNPNILVLPIDINNNGKIDSDENFYGTSTQLIKAIAQGKYPSPPSRDLYLVAKGKPTNRVVIEFLKFILEQGQAFTVPNGYISLHKDKIKAAQAKLK